MCRDRVAAPSNVGIGGSGVSYSSLGIVPWSPRSTHIGISMWRPCNSDSHSHGLRQSRRRCIFFDIASHERQLMLVPGIIPTTNDESFFLRSHTEQMGPDTCPSPFTLTSTSGATEVTIHHADCFCILPSAEDAW